MGTMSQGSCEGTAISRRGRFRALVLALALPMLGSAVPVAERDPARSPVLLGLVGAIASGDAAAAEHAGPTGPPVPIGPPDPALPGALAVEVRGSRGAGDRAMTGAAPGIGLQCGPVRAAS